MAHRLAVLVHKLTLPPNYTLSRRSRSELRHYCLAHLDFNWAKLRALKEKYGEKVTISDPGEVGSVLLTSEHETIGIDEMVKEFEITLLDEYLDNSRAYRHKPGIME